ncbi:hypothetical protein FGO68_gene16524 [Halteria grandinella]|uniref:Uncharacterized protein n=1 Tax=Halteria grandinella TaxID=5974 RepID=A0A8J8T5I2_HALGN|nr:hypothetical protein FGO68_gene16524 [Halteria grandinella]
MKNNSTANNKSLDQRKQQQQPQEKKALPPPQPPQPQSLKRASTSSFGHLASQAMQPPMGPPVRRRESKKISQKYQSQISINAQNLAQYLESYNDMKALQEAKELPIRQVYLRRIGLKLVRIKCPALSKEERKVRGNGLSTLNDLTSIQSGDGEFLFRFPILEYVEEISKIMLMNEFELLYWYHVLEKYLTEFAKDPIAAQNISANAVRLLFFQTAVYVKRFLMFMQGNSSANASKYREHQIQCIMAYIQTYHYVNFQEKYLEFDREHYTLLGPDFENLRQKGGNSGDQFGEIYEQFSYLNGLKLKDIHQKFHEMRAPFQTDERANVVDYNWQVDGILKNSQSYNKEGKNGGKGGNGGESVEPQVQVIQNGDLMSFNPFASSSHQEDGHANGKKQNTTAKPVVKQEPVSSNNSKAKVKEEERYSPTYGIEDPFGGGAAALPPFGGPYGFDHSYHSEQNNYLQMLNHQMFNTNYYPVHHPQLMHGDSTMFGLPRPGSLAKQNSISGLIGKRNAREEDQDNGGAFGSGGQLGGTGSGSVLRPKPKPQGNALPTTRSGNVVQSPGQMLMGEVGKGGLRQTGSIPPAVDLDKIQKHMQNSMSTGFTKPGGFYPGPSDADIDMMSTIGYPNLSMNKSNSFLSSMLLQKKPSTSNYYQPNASSISKGDSAFQHAIPSSNSSNRPTTGLSSNSALLGAVTNLIRQSSTSEFGKGGANGGNRDSAMILAGLHQPLLKLQKSKSVTSTGAEEAATSKPMNLRKQDSKTEKQPAAKKSAISPPQNGKK